MTKKSTILRIINHNYSYNLSTIQKNKALEIMDSFNYYEIEGFTNKLIVYNFLMRDKTKYNSGILLFSESISWNTVENVFSCSCLEKDCPHIYYIIYFFSGLTGIYSYLVLGYLDLISTEIFSERLYLRFNLAE